MQSMTRPVTRKVGKLMGRGPGDNAKVSVLLNDYEDADRVLAKVTNCLPLRAPSSACILRAMLPSEC